jgi:phosphoesterase RecJ-like protein
MADAQAREEDSDNLINFLRNINGVEVALLFREVDSGKTKVSCRSRNKFNAALFLQRFGGGGHRAAAGATVAMSLPQACSVVLGCLHGALEDAP